MSALNIVLWVAGVILVVLGWRRASRPWNRYQALREQDANVSRYEAWRGGVRTHDDGPTGASVAMSTLRRQAQVAAGIAGLGVVLVFLGFLVK
jgi:hypothetical protein